MRWLLLVQELRLLLAEFLTDEAGAKLAGEAGSHCHGSGGQGGM